tara:strand:+ start:5370 stop:5585 length:216 start_codon:yes stop_codon:yes gene_type:complete
MATVKLDDIEYDTENFSDEQNNMLAEIQFNSNIQRQAEYKISGLKIMSAEVIRRLKETLVETPEDDDKEDA